MIQFSSIVFKSMPLPLFLGFVRLRFLGKVLSVERAGNKPTLDSKLKASQAHSGEDAIPPTSLAKDATQHFSSGSMPASEPIAPRLGVDYPFPPHLEYVFPFHCRYSSFLHMSPMSCRSIFYITVSQSQQFSHGRYYLWTLYVGSL